MAVSSGAGLCRKHEKCDGKGAGGAENRRVHRCVEKIHSVRKPWALIFHTAIHDNRMLAERAFYCLCRRRHKVAMIAEPNWTSPRDSFGAKRLRNGDFYGNKSENQDSDVI